MVKTILAGLVASTMFTGVADAKTAEFKEMCGSLSNASVMNPIELSERDECWLDVYRADVNAGVLKSFAWARVADQYYSVPLRELRFASDPTARFMEIIGQDVENLQIEMMQENIEEKEVILQEAQVDLAELEAARAEIESLKAMIADKEAVIEALTAAGLEKDILIENLKADKASLEVQLASALADAAAKQVIIDARDATIVGLNATIDTRDAAIVELNNTIAAKQSQIDSLNVELATAKAFTTIAEAGNQDLVNVAQFAYDLGVTHGKNVVISNIEATTHVMDGLEDPTYVDMEDLVNQIYQYGFNLGVNSVDTSHEVTVSGSYTRTGGSKTSVSSTTTVTGDMTGENAINISTPLLAAYNNGKYDGAQSVVVDDDATAVGGTLSYTDDGIAVAMTDSVASLTVNLSNGQSVIISMNASAIAGPSFVFNNTQISNADGTTSTKYAVRHAVESGSITYDYMGTDVTQTPFDDSRGNVKADSNVAFSVAHGDATSTSTENITFPPATHTTDTYTNATVGFNVTVTNGDATTSAYTINLNNASYTNTVYTNAIGSTHTLSEVTVAMSEIKNAIEDAFETGYDKGYDDGYQDGYADGFDDGFAAARAE